MSTYAILNGYSRQSNTRTDMHKIVHVFEYAPFTGHFSDWRMFQQDI
ncbi:unnamed protein product [Acanthoscelides obtectus]|uniref:Uncharacterized protein n=1 Tax=Acanthoscelides obtectus TaxID=200917 RepID=A0A9P0M574_ACAOB|nr:unnamed protein product [Acanthoscelides obtectus]CAH2014967.1 unnamed protein product [Acanthoscelides obtectus]CAK1641296.1 hypothetical protein AOBTE_LOCUS12308 [Acanthoscelides obtectus]CAK1641300.1 hypothetical protein AOBTE_LOCUS12312 [Acanthoscelides obtectus]